MQKEISIVTGANGHLGNNLLRLLIEKGYSLRGTVRQIEKAKPFSNLDCEWREADLMDKKSMLRAFEGGSTLYAVGAAFRLWAKNPEKEIYQTNVQGTQNLFEAAHEVGIKNIVYVSSIAALDFTSLPAKVENGYNKDRRNCYYNSKNDSDRLALELGKRYGIRTVIVLPSAMIGGFVGKMSYSNELVWQIMNGKIPLDTNFSLNWVDVEDVAKAMLSARERGKDQHRYILANKKHTTIQESVEIASQLFPERKLNIPPKASKTLLKVIASFMEAASWLTGHEPQLQRHYVDMFYGLKQDFDISLSEEHLHFQPTSSREVLQQAMLAMSKRKV
ncbi:MAG: NAD-dependent epimerase/dehydratase family protein [Bacteroidota bacterium]